MGKHLTDDQLKIILVSPTLTEAALAAYLGTSKSTVGYARRKLRTGNWVCAVRFEPCRRCGEVVTIRGPHNNQFYHAECAKENQKDAWNRAHKARPNTPKRPTSLEVQQQTRAVAFKQSARWTVEDDAVMREMMLLPSAVIAIKLGRTQYAVVQRRKRLRRLGNSSRA